MGERIFSCAAAAAFGLEGAIAGELKRLGLREVRAENGLVRFRGTALDAYLCNLRLRFSDRVYLVLAEAPCLSFEDLFQLVSSVPWIFERLKARRGRTLFPEKGASFPVHISVHSDTVRILLDTSGSSLSRRGYRTWNGEAPLRETLAAALVEFSPWRPGMPLYDPCCGTGTLLAEAALRMGHLAPGGLRSFAMEQFAFFPREEGRRLREQVLAEGEPDRIRGIAGSDVDPEAIELARRHLRQAGLEGRVDLTVMPLQEVTLEEEGGVFLCNPPYGERLGDQESCRKLYRDLARLRDRHPTWALCAISSDPSFEKACGRRADKKRRLYNGRLECQLYTFLP